LEDNISEIIHTDDSNVLPPLGMRVFSYRDPRLWNIKWDKRKVISFGTNVGTPSMSYQNFSPNLQQQLQNQQTLHEQALHQQKQQYLQRQQHFNQEKHDPKHSNLENPLGTPCLILNPPVFPPPINNLLNVANQDDVDIANG
jgi:hypothetical protein